MIPNPEVEKVLDDFGKAVIQQVRRNMTLQSLSKTKALYDSFNRELDELANGYELSINSEEYNRYGKFVDFGVKGIKEGNSLKGWSFKQGIENKPSYKHFLTDKINRPVSIGQAVATSYVVWYKGLKPTEFFTRPFEAAFERLPDRVVEAYGMDLEIFIKRTIDADI